MLITTTNSIEGKQIVEYKELVFGEIIAGSNFIRDFFAGITDFIGGRSGAYESRLTRGREEALAEMKENAQKLGAIVGVEVNYTTITSESKSMFMIVASGTAVIVR